MKRLEEIGKNGHFWAKMAKNGQILTRNGQKNENGIFRRKSENVTCEHLWPLDFMQKIRKK